MDAALPDFHFFQRALVAIGVPIEAAQAAGWYVFVEPIPHLAAERFFFRRIVQIHMVSPRARPGVATASIAERRRVARIIADSSGQTSAAISYPPALRRARSSSR